MVTPRESEPAATATIRQRLIAGVVAVVAEGGYRGATVDQVLARANSTWSEFTDEFKDLDECFLAASDWGFECAARKVEIAGDGKSHAPSSLSAMIGALLMAIDEQPALARLCLLESAALGARGLKVKDMGLQRFVTVLERLPVSTLTAEMLAGGIYSALEHRIRSGELGDRGQLATDLERLWLPLLGRPLDQPEHL